MRVGVITFPGSLDDADTRRAVEMCGGEATRVWHGDTDLGDVDAVLLPGGFSYGDYLRTGAVAHRAPIMAAVRTFAADGGPVLGICNGFQILCEADLLPGALLRNVDLRFTCRPVELVVGTEATPLTRTLEPGERLTIPVKNGEGRYYADPATLDRLEAEDRVVLRYAAGDNPNGSERDIAAVCNGAGNVVGVMPHPEHAVDPTLIGGTDGRRLLESLLGAGVPA